MATTCSVEGCERPREANGQGRFRLLCAGHNNRKRLHGDVLAHIPLERGGWWRNAVDYSQPVSYMGAHSRLMRMRGPARKHSCVDCGEQAAEWSYDGKAEYEFSGPVQMGSKTREGRWSGNPDDFSPRCKACHSTFDREKASV